MYSTLIRKVLPVFLGVMLWMVTTVAPLQAQGLIRDPEIERALDELARPIFIAAGLSPARIDILIVNNRSLNAFVTDPGHIFIHSGLLLKMETPAQLQSVLAHEAAHIANGHITRRLANARNASTVTGIGMLLAAAAAAAGSGEAAGGIAAGATSVAQRGFFAHTRAEEASADQAGVRYLVRAGIPTAGSVEVLELFRGQEALSLRRQDPYVRSHPLTRDRMRALQGFVAGNPGGHSTDAANYWFARAKGKLSAFTQAPSWTLRRVRGDTSQIAMMRSAVAYHRRPDPARAIATIDALARARPNDPYVHDLRGQILLESRQFPAAVNAYARAVQLAPNQPLILGQYGRALLALNTTDGNRRALQVLERARDRDITDIRIMRDLAVAYAKADRPGMASMVTAERYALRGRLSDAQIHAQRAVGLLPRGSTAWRRADDVLRAAQSVNRR
jgi:predicted Zn-dependent protease